MTLENHIVYLAPSVWALLDSFAAARGITSRSLAIEELVRQLTEPAKGR